MSKKENKEKRLKDFNDEIVEFFSKLSKQGIAIFGFAVREESKELHVIGNVDNPYSFLLDMMRKAPVVAEMFKYVVGRHVDEILTQDDRDRLDKIMEELIDQEMQDSKKQVSKDKIEESLQLLMKLHGNNNMA